MKTVAALVLVAGTSLAHAGPECPADYGQRLTITAAHHMTCSRWRTTSPRRRDALTRGEVLISSG
ncbi:hypothetical protein [Roseateles noduli]|uniref:hypothetical protein n=1 Tax=Roseateles noduli TaxID=2052484 RepID=UPI003D658931